MILLRLIGLLFQAPQLATQRHPGTLPGTAQRPPERSLSHELQPCDLRPHRGALSPYCGD